MDYFTKWVECVAVPDMEAKITANVLIESWISRYGVPWELHSDQGKGFDSELIRELCNLLGVNKSQTTPYRPQSDGMCERFMRFLKNTMLRLIQNGQTRWEETVPWIMLSYRCSEHAVTGYSPARCLFGNELRLPVDLMHGKAPDGQVSPDRFVNDLQVRLRLIHKSVRSKINSAIESTGRYEGRAPKIKELVPGQNVLVFDPSRRVGQCPKLNPQWKGPAVVVNRISDWVYRVKFRNRFVIRHRDHLCPVSPS